MVCLGLEPGMAGWKVQTNPLRYGGIQVFLVCTATFWRLFNLKNDFICHQRFIQCWNYDLEIKVYLKLPKAAARFLRRVYASD